MDLNDLKSWLIGMQNIGVVRTPSGDTYGPAESRFGRAPIKFTTSHDMFTGMPIGQAGQFDPSMLNMIHPTAARYGQMTVNPLGQDVTTPGKVVGHEDIHAVFSHLQDRGLEQAIVNAPEYPEVARALQKDGRGGRMSRETLAYMGAFEPEVTPSISPALRNAFMNSAIKNLNQLDPNATAKFIKMTGFQPTQPSLYSPASSEAQGR